MANPDPQALRDAAASLRDQAKAARDATVDQFRSIQTERKDQYSRAERALAVAKTELKSNEDTLAARQKAIVDEKAAIDKLQQTAVDADKAGDPAKATEAREMLAYHRAELDALSTNADRSQQDVNQSRIDAAQAENGMANAEQRFQQVSNDFKAAETQLDAMENKAKLLDDAGLKLGLAASIDNPVERADAELAAEKVLKDANAIILDTGPITKITGQDLQVPDVNALPASGAATGDGSAAADGSSSPSDPAAGSAGSGGADDATPASDATTPGHLEDDFATVASGGGTGGPTAGPTGGPTGDPDGAQPGGSGDAETRGDSAQSEAGTELGGPVTIAPTDDPLGGTPDLTAAPDPLGVDTMAPTDASSGPDVTASAGDASGDGGVTDTSLGAPADQTVAAADPMPDPGAAPADTFDDFGTAPVDDTPVSVSDDSDS
jgi:hypothetical protein